MRRAGQCGRQRAAWSATIRHVNAAGTSARRPTAWTWRSWRPSTAAIDCDHDETEAARSLTAIEQRAHGVVRLPRDAAIERALSVGVATLTRLPQPGRRGASATRT
jgi:hypothetical protein